MRKGGGKAKGASFERKCCVALSLWISHGEHEDLLWRSAMSGGRATVAAKLGKNLRRQAGDVSAVSIEGCSLTGMFYLECKHVKRLSLEKFIIDGKGPLANYWRTACVEAKKHHKKPMLIAKQNLLPTLVVTRINVLPLNPLVTIEGVCEVCLLDALLATTYDAEAL